jgi:hypothetical protein
MVLFLHTKPYGVISQVTEIFVGESLLRPGLEADTSFLVTQSISPLIRLLQHVPTFAHFLSQCCVAQGRCELQIFVATPAIFLPNLAIVYDVIAFNRLPFVRIICQGDEYILFIY